jgi:hypothetical protein
MQPLFHIPIKRTRDGGKTHYIEKYWALPFGRELRIHSGTFTKYNLQIGINFRYRGDEIIWLWPWKRKGNKWLSICASGNGDFGDATFSSLVELDQFWEAFGQA